MPFDRLLIVSNRLPVSARLDDGAVRLTRASGGLATGLRAWHERAGGLWIGWPGDTSRFTAAQMAELDERLQQRSVVPVHLTPEQIERYYHDFSNRVIWPLFHYLIDRVPVDTTSWRAYHEVNEAFADAVARAYRPGDAIWVHDYQLLLLPALLRERLPTARIGFFLHIPFPSSEVFRTLPWRREVLQGLLGADVIGFHTFAYLRHFLASLLHVEGVETEVTSVRVGHRDVRLGVFPMGIDAQRFDALARDPDVEAQAAAIRHGAGGRRIIVGVDRLDYTKGIPRRLLALERLLTRDASLRDRIRYVQVAVPSRGEVDSYQVFRRQVEEAVGRINGSCTTLHSTPIHYMHRSVSPRELVALYSAADVMLVTPLRDGMNLVAKEFVASRADGDGVLVLSEFAGAAAELGDALVVNPYDVDAVSNAIGQALAMPQEERRRRMRALRQRVTSYDVHAWARSFIELLEAPAPAYTASDAAVLEAATSAALRAPLLHVLLGYDGTLVPIADAPELAIPDDELLELLGTLSRGPGVAVHIVSSRPREWLQRWFGHLAISLWAENGLWRRAADATRWLQTAPVPAGWMRRIYPILEQFAASTPGAGIEVKTASIAWHYRRVEEGFGARQAHELRMLLGDALSNQPLEVLEGRKVIEVHLRGISRGTVGQQLGLAAGDAVIACGDDRADEELFRALPGDAVTMAVGQRLAGARFHVEDCAALRALLHRLAHARAGTLAIAARGAR